MHLDLTFKFSSSGFAADGEPALGDPAVEGRGDADPALLGLVVLLLALGGASVTDASADCACCC